MACGSKLNHTSALIAQLWLYVKNTTDLTDSSFPIGRTLVVGVVGVVVVRNALR